MPNLLRWTISILLLAASISSLISFGIVGKGRGEGGNFSFDYEVMYLGGLAWLKGRNPYDQKELDRTFHEYQESQSHISSETFYEAPFSYPPHAAALLLPLSVFNFSAAKYGWMCLNLVALACVVAMTLASLRCNFGSFTNPLKWSVPVAYIVGNPITTNVFWQGQTALISLAASMGGWFLSRRGRWLLAGLCLGVGSIKPQLCLFIMIWLLLERSWKPLAVSVLTAAVMSAYPTSLQGPVGMTLAWKERLSTHKDFHANKAGFEHVVGVQSFLAAANLPAPPMEPVGILAVICLWCCRNRFSSDDLLGLMMGLTVTFVFVHDGEYVALIPLLTALWLHYWEEAWLGPVMLILSLAFMFPRRIIRELNSPVLSHWRTIVVLLMLLLLLGVASKRSARREPPSETVWTNA